MTVPPNALDFLPAAGDPGKSSQALDALPMPVEQKTPLDDAAVQRRSFKHAVGKLVDSAPAEGEGLVEHYANMRKMAENIIRIGNEEQLHKEAANRDLLQRSTSYAALAAADSQISDDVRYGARLALQAALQENLAKTTAEATQKRYVANLQAAISSGRYDEAYMMSRLYSDGNAYAAATKRMERRAFMQDLIEEEIAGEENRFWLFNITDVLSYAIPFATSAGQSGNVANTKQIGNDSFTDNLMSGERLNREASALYHMTDHEFYNGGAKNFVKKVTENVKVFGGLGKNNMMRQSLYDMYTRRTPGVDEANAWDALDVVTAPFAVFDIMTAGKLSKSALSALKGAGANSINSHLVTRIMLDADSVGLPAAAAKYGVEPDDIEKAMKFSALNPEANPHATSAAGEIITDLDRAEEAAKRLLGNPLATERLTEEEVAQILPLIKSRTAKDFGRYVHDVQLDSIELANGSKVLSPVVRLGNTDKGLFVTKAQAEKYAGNIGLADAKVVDVVSENGVLYAIEGRLPITESQFYVAHAADATRPKNFIERFLYGSRQTSADTSYGLAEVVTAKRQRIVTAIMKTVGPYFDALNAKERKMLKDILVRAERDQKWYNHMEFSLLWARLSGVGDDVHEITDTAIALGDIAAPGGRIDPMFAAEKAFADLKEQSAAIGKKIDELVKESGAKDEAEFWSKYAAEDAGELHDQLTAINAQIAKGVQPVNTPALDAFLEPHTYKAWRAASATPPPAEGMVRVYHGGVPGEGSRWVTDSLEDAKGWANRGDGMIVQYVDIPKDHIGRGLPEDIAFGVTPRSRFELSAEEMATARPFKEGENFFPPEHEELWKALDKAADDALALQSRAGDISKARTRKAAAMSMAKEAREATPHLARLAELFSNQQDGVLVSEISAKAVDGVKDARLYSMIDKQTLIKLAAETHLVAEGGIRVNGIRVLELPGGRFFAWAGQDDFHENVLVKLNTILEERGLPKVAKEDVNNIWIEVVAGKNGNKPGKVFIDEPTWTGQDYTWVHSGTLNFNDFARNVDSFSVDGPAFNKRVRDAESKANTALREAMTGGVSTEKFREAVDNGLTLSGTKKLVNANGDVLHTNSQKVMSRPLEYDPSMDGRVSAKARAAFNKMVELNNIEHLLRNEEAYLQKAVRGMQTFSFVSNGAVVVDVDGIIYRAGNIPNVPSSRVYNISDDVHYVARTDEKLKEGVSLRLTDADISRMLKKQGYVLVKLEQPQALKGGITVQWFIGKPADFQVKPLKFEQIGFKAGGHREYVDKYYGKQTRVGKQGDTGEVYLMNPHTFIVGTKAQVEAWSAVMNDARAIFNNVDDVDRRLELLGELLDNKPGYPSAAELEQMVKNGEFDPKYPVEAVYDREVPSDHAKLKSQGWDDLADEEQSGLNSYYQTTGRMYTSPKGERLRDWEGQDATVIDPFEAMNRSLSQIAGLSSLSDYKLREVEKWVKTFGKYLDTGGLPRDASPMRIFQESVFRKDMPEAQKIKNSAEAQRDTIKRVLGWRSDVDREFEFMSRQLVDFVSGGKPTKWNKRLNRSLNWTLEKDPVARARMMAFHMKMGFGNVAQFPMQITTMLAATSIDPVNGMRGMFNVAPMTLYLAKNAGDEMLDFWIKLGWHKTVGFDDPADWVEMMRAAKQSGRFDIGGAHQLINYNGVEAAQGLIGKTGKLVDKGAFFFNEAERWNQTVAWTIAWHRAKQAGLTPGTAKFNEVLMKLSGDFSFNMNKAGAAAWQQGWASIPTQFLSYQARVLEALLGKQFTLGEKLRLLLGQAVLYGTAGIPFGAYLSEQMRSSSGETADLGTWEGLAERGIIDTMIFQLTGEDTQFSERAAVGAFVTDTFRELIGQSKYGETSFVDVMGGPLYGISKSIFFGETGKPGTFWEVVRYMSAESGGDTGLPLTSAAITDLAKNISSFNNAYKAYMVWNYGQYITTSGKVAVDELPSTDAFAVFLGLSPGEYREYVAKQDWRRNRNEIVSQVAGQIIELRQKKWREPDASESVDSQMETFRKLHPEDIWIDAWEQANRSPANEAIYDGLARRYEIEKNQERMALEAKRNKE